MEQRGNDRIRWDEPTRRAVGAVIAVVSVVPIYILDRATGATPDLSGLYLVPVVLVAYWLGMWPGLTMAGVVLAAEVAAYPVGHRSVVFVHALTHAATYSFAAVVTARLRSQLNTIGRLEERRDYDLEIARRLQDSTREAYVPSGRLEADVAIRTESAQELGGDFVLVRESANGLFACIADISGHGIPAALFSALLQDAVGTALFQSDDPEHIIAAVNQRVFAALPSEMFVTMFCCLLSQRTLRYINAGHEPGLLNRVTSTTSMELTSLEGIPLGTRDDLKIPAGEVILETGDILLLYTDGVTDTIGFGRDEQRVGRFFASRRWPTAEVAASAIVAEAKRGASEQPDDMSIVVIRIPAV